MSLLSSQEILALKFNAASGDRQREMIFSMLQQIAARMALLDERDKGKDLGAVATAINQRLEEISVKKGS